MGGVDNSAEDVFDVERILDDRVVKGKKQYLIKWIGYPDSENTWEYEENLMCEEMLKSYMDTKTKKESEKKTKEKQNAKKTSTRSKAALESNKPAAEPKSALVPLITNEWHNEIEKVIGASINEYGVIEIEYILKKNGQNATSPSDVLKYKAPLKLIEFYEENLSFPE
ncbi:uncharacterized protein VICG_01173 [Vittaforma corneae ATCC 50505]|uniref:Chromo domain-containing protein n=1 Tax=Vittaforma corneae (strain ATCC 50505) TaxID=993615 RepID=L2GLU5_VITCO|nr:uncharacterized protein VICG_01173 [Vittaforma corneae ATCC 50505]ELA41821.1 hypothetical protein VICG_01173 [Vittaforma corneae ATCC 50505]